MKSKYQRQVKSTLNTVEPGVPITFLARVKKVFTMPAPKPIVASSSLPSMSSAEVSHPPVAMSSTSPVSIVAPRPPKKVAPVLVIKDVLEPVPEPIPEPEPPFGSRAWKLRQFVNQHFK